jgi:hypothetical protein
MFRDEAILCSSQFVFVEPCIALHGSALKGDSAVALDPAWL